MKDMNDKPVKIFVDAHILDKGYHGTHTFVRELYTELLGRYPWLDIYFGTYEPQMVKAVFPQVDGSHILPYKKGRPTFLRFLFDIPAYIRTYRFDYAHFQYMGVQWPTSCVSIVTTHDVLYNDYPDSFPVSYRLIRKLLFGNSIRKADIKTTVSLYSRDRIALHYRIPGEEIHVIPNAVDGKLLGSSLSKSEAAARISGKYGLKNFILYVSRIEPRKNHLLLLEKYLSLELHKKGIPLVFIGDQSIRIPALDRLMRGLSPEQRGAVHWIRQVDQEDLSAFYRSCRLFIYPSKAEGFGIPPLEAAICRAPVLCSRAPAMASYGFFNPYTFDPDSEAELGEKLMEMILRPPGADFLDIVHEKVSRLYSRERSAAAFYSLIRQREQVWDYV
jgi:glycosyltransferase involved in cell wall biosynthesis